ncbi:hypothetical protein [Shewanella zhangzhouensis]|uniref:hypothetical protein n=1 Tax=Shewanella zhangzhouensis TaxID=2864213 RepID=UPI001C65B4FB|nr:hypothetical protein [Shewanella zhangzhouensis]QYK04915.1 hypothetical protein K0H63_18015 [Shewanella zhangzhouensis]
MNELTHAMTQANLELVIETLPVIPKGYQRLIEEDDCYMMLIVQECFNVDPEAVMLKDWKAVTREEAEQARAEGRPAIVSDMAKVYSVAA